LDDVYTNSLENNKISENECVLISLFICFCARLNNSGYNCPLRLRTMASRLYIHDVILSCKYIHIIHTTWEYWYTFQ